MAYTFDKANADALSRHHTQYFEMMGDHALYHDGWIASTKVIRPPWEVIDRQLAERDRARSKIDAHASEYQQHI
jgi:arylsulfatase A-like enzyme